MSRYKTKHYEKQLKQLETVLKGMKGGLLTVHYRDGSIRRIRPDMAITLCRTQADDIESFSGGSKGNGLLADLVNGLLTSCEGC